MSTSLSPRLRQPWLRTPLACACAALISLPVAAQTAMPDLVVTASRTAQTVQDALPATTLITRADIDQAQTPDLPTLLSTVAGVQLSQTGAMGSAASASLRGANTNHTLVLVDGVPINEAMYGSASLEHIPLAMVDHIEIVRGNVSAIYGSAALGGVIQIFTRQAGNKPSLTLSSQIGSYGMRQLDASGAIKLASGTSIAASAEALNNRGFPSINANETPGALSQDDGYTRRAVGLSVRQDIGQGNSIGLRLRDATGTLQYDPENSPDTQTYQNKYTQSGVVLDGKFKAAQGLDITAAVTNSTEKWNDVADGYGYYNTISNGANLGLQYALSAHENITAGAETTHQSVQSSTLLNASARTQNSVRLGYVGHLGQNNQQEWQINLRSDHYSDFGSANTGYLGYAYRLTNQWRVSASYSTGFNAPSFSQLYYPGYSNPNLVPERVKSAELGLQYAQQNLDARATLFSNRYTNLIANNINYIPVNVNSASINGIEFAAKGHWDDTQIHADLTLQNPRDLTDQVQLTRRAKTLAHLGASQRWGVWTFGGELRYNSSSPDNSYNVNTYTSTPVTLAGFTTVGLTTNYQINPQWSAFGRVDNLTNAHYETAYGYNQPGRSAFVGIRWQPQF